MRVLLKVDHADALTQPAVLTVDGGLVVADVRPLLGPCPAVVDVALGRTCVALTLPNAAADHVFRLVLASDTVREIRVPASALPGAVFGRWVPGVPTLLGVTVACVLGVRRWARRAR